MASAIEAGLEGAKRLTRLGWYLSLNRLAEWKSSRLGLRPRYTPVRPVPTEREIMADLSRLLTRDADGVAAGILPPLDDGLAPAEAVRRAALMLGDLPDALRRRAAGDAATAREASEADDLPEYYRQDFHFQKGGYLSEESARLYDVQVETLFLGGAAPMRREALRPIADFMKGRDQRGVALCDVGCGTGRLLRDARRLYPAMRLTGVDLSESYLDEARRHLQGRRPAKLLRANGEAMPLPGDSQDIVTAVFLFHELPREARRQVAAEMARVLKPGGMLVIVDSLQTNDRPGWDGLLEGFPVRFHEPFFADYVEDDLDTALIEAGLVPHASWTSFLAKILVVRKPTERLG
ncbi:MAG: class I SAM-dependent methyltransferase [Hyphomicrobiaceae bacterium]